MQTMETFFEQLESVPEERLQLKHLEEILYEDIGYVILHEVANLKGFLQYAPLVFQDRYRFPRYFMFKRMTERVPAKYLYIYSVIYCYREAECFAHNYDQVYAETFSNKFVSDNMLSEKHDHYNKDSIYTNLQFTDFDPDVHL